MRKASPAFKIPTSPLPSPELAQAVGFSAMAQAALKGITAYEKTLRGFVPEGLECSLTFEEMARRASASDLFEGMVNLTCELDRLALTKAEDETIRERMGRFEVLVKALLRAIAIARAKNRGLC